MAAYAFARMSFAGKEFLFGMLLATMMLPGIVLLIPQFLVIKTLGLDIDKLNVNGGAIALGHPLGCTGAKLTAAILRELARRHGRYGMVTMCVGGGMGAAGIFERLN